MPTSVAELFAAADLTPSGPVRWGAPIQEGGSGVYAVSLTSEPDSIRGSLAEPILDRRGIATWLDHAPALTLDGGRPTATDLGVRIARFWLPDEVVLYIGLATSLRSRVRGYYRTPLGARRPHSGGYFLKVLENLGDLWVYYAPHPDPSAAESLMLRRFCSGVSDRSKLAIHDPAHPFPFANLEWPPGVRKSHGIRGARGVVGARRASPTEQPLIASVAVTGRAPRAGSGRTQPVTAADRAAGRIRIPSSGAAPTKSLLPPDNSIMDIVLPGSRLRVRWTPRMEPDRERSGIISVGAELRGLVGVNEVLEVTADPEGDLTIE